MHHLRAQTCAALLLVVAAGAGYERFFMWRAWREFPPPGKLVDIGGRRLQIDCRGRGSPVVVFENGLDAIGSLGWSPVHAQVAELTRACAYSRAGTMWSDPRRGASDGIAIADDLHSLLANAGERPPFVLVGFSLGGPYVVIYTARFPLEVAGLVLVDASHPDQFRRFDRISPTFRNSLFSMWDRLEVACGWTGILQVDWRWSFDAPRRPSRDAQAESAFAPHSLVGMFKEEDAVMATLAEAGASHALGDRPTFVLTSPQLLPDDTLRDLKLTKEQARQEHEMWEQMQDDEASWSSRSQHQIVAGSGHNVTFDRPDAIIRAVRSVVNDVRAARPVR